jgi:hypothetical protein
MSLPGLPASPVRAPTTTTTVTTTTSTPPHSFHTTQLRNRRYKESRIELAKRRLAEKAQARK